MSHSDTAVDHDVPSTPDVRATIRSEYLQSTLDALGALVSECRLEFGPGGLSASAADPASVALVEASLDADAFDVYDAEGELVGVDIDRLGEVIGMAASGQTVELLLDAETRRLHVVIDELAYTLGLIDPAAIREPPAIDESAFIHAARAVVEGGEIDRFVGAAGMVADHLALGVDEADAALYVDAEGDTDHVSLRLAAVDLKAFDAGDAHSLFSLDYLRDVTTPMPADGPVALRLGTEVPVQFDFETADGAGSVTYLLSPRLVRT